MMRKIRSISISIVTVGIILAISATIILYGKGYRLDVQNRSVGATGLLTTTSDPVGATVFINGKKQTATNANINLSPDWYTVTIAKEGYQSWEKRVRVQGEVVARADAMLFPTNPSLYAITTNGAINPTRSPDGSKLAFIVPATLESTNGGQLISREGIWVLDMTDKPLGLNRDARHIVTNDVLPTEKATLLWSPDSKQLLVAIPKEFSISYYVVDTDKTNDRLTLVPDITTITSQWKELYATKENERIAGLKEELLAIATKSASIIAFSPDETKILYEATKSATIPQIITPTLIGTNPTEEERTIKPGFLYVYDRKEDKNYTLGEARLYLEGTPSYLICQKEASAPLVGKTTVGKSTVSKTPTPVTLSPCRQQALQNTIQWLASNRHLVIAGNDRVEIMEYDGTNRKTVYAGPFVDGFVTVWPNGGKIVVLTNLNPSASLTPNLYAVGIR